MLFCEIVGGIIESSLFPRLIAGLFILLLVGFDCPPLCFVLSRRGQVLFVGCVVSTCLMCRGGGGGFGKYKIITASMLRMPLHWVKSFPRR